MRPALARSYHILKNNNNKIILLLRVDFEKSFFLRLKSHLGLGEVSLSDWNEE